MKHIVENVRHIVAIELLCASEAAEARGIENLGPINVQTHGAVRRLVTRLDRDREISSDIGRLACAIHEGLFRTAVDT